MLQSDGWHAVLPGHVLSCDNAVLVFEEVFLAKLLTNHLTMSLLSELLTGSFSVRGVAALRVLLCQKTNFCKDICRRSLCKDVTREVVVQCWITSSEGRSHGLKCRFLPPCRSGSYSFNSEDGEELLNDLNKQGQLQKSGPVPLPPQVLCLLTSCSV